MQRIVITLVALVAAACGQGNEVLFGEPAQQNPDEEIEGLTPPNTPERPLFRDDVLPEDPEERGYVIGHALSIAIYSRTLPRYLEGTGFTYRPGVSSLGARTSYAFAEVIDEESLESGGDC